MSFLKKIFSQKKEILPAFDLSVIGIDMHSHLIPGIDDGSKSMDETIAMLAKFENLGIKKVITTPHIMSDYYKNTPEIILGGLADVKKTAKELNLKIEIEPAAEYYFDETLLARLNSGEKLLTFGENHVLFEFSFHTEPPKIDTLIFEFVTKGYKPVLAHFERYAFLFDSFDRVKEWRSKGVLIQMNYNSLFGHYGPEVQKQARRLVDEGQVDFVATDCHRMDHLMTLEANLSDPYMHKLGELNLQNSTLK